MSSPLPCGAAVVGLLMLACTAATAQVSALGRIEPADGVRRISAPLLAESTGGVVLSTLHVDAGDRVEAGQLLAVTEPAALLEALLAEARSAEAQQRLAAQAAAADAEARCVQAEVAQREAQRRARLGSQSFVTVEEVERAAGEADARAADCRAARAHSRAVAGQTEVSKARSARAEAALQRAYIRAPFAGQVLQVHARSGEMVGPAGVLELGQVDRMQAIAEVFEADIGGVLPGQSARVHSRALAQPLQGHVLRVRPQVRKQDQLGTDPAAAKDARIVEVEIALDDPAPVAALSHLQVEIVIGGPQP